MERKTEYEQCHNNLQILNSGRNGIYNNKVPNSPTISPISPGAIMGLLPCGTRNVLVKSLNYPAEVMECCHNIINGNTQKIDVVSATVTANNGSDIVDNHRKTITKIFLNAAEIGFGVEIIDRSKKVRSKIKSRLVSTMTSVISTVPTYKSNTSEIILNDGNENILF